MVYRSANQRTLVKVPGDSFNPQIATSGDNVYLVWEDSTPGSSDIFFSFSTDNGLSFSQPKNISKNTGGSFQPQIATSGDNVYVVWYDATQIILPGPFDIFFSFSNDNGQSFSQPEKISESTARSLNPQIATSADNVYVVWYDDIPSSSEIFFSFRYRQRSIVQPTKEH